MSARVNIQGRRFSYLVVTKFIGTDKGGHALWECLCDCGNKKIVPSHKLREGQIKSCGCMHFEACKTHGLSNTRLYHIWRTMKSRCLVKTNHKYLRYGGRGISVCDEWRDSFQAFYDWAMANGYSDNLSIDRIDVNGNYEPTNCQWITASENSKKAFRDRLGEAKEMTETKRDTEVP